MKRILTGDRPTGKLHIGHYFGSLANRIKLQTEYETFLLIANIQALSDNFANPEKIAKSIDELILDYYAIGVDFDNTHVYIQSDVPEVNEVFIYLANFSTVQQIMQNPTIKQEFADKGFEKSIPLGFFIHPIHQVADILLVNGDLVPVGKDQAPMVEFAAAIARHFNSTYNCEVFNIPEPLYGVTKNVSGIDGNAKMSKSLNNAIYLSDTEEELLSKVKKVKSDHMKTSASAPGNPANSVVFEYLELLHSIDQLKTVDLDQLKLEYTQGILGDAKLKEILFLELNAFLKPIRERRIEGQSKLDELKMKVKHHNQIVRQEGLNTLNEMKVAMKILCQ